MKTKMARDPITLALVLPGFRPEIVVAWVLYHSNPNDANPKAPYLGLHSAPSQHGFKMQNTSNVTIPQS